MGKRTHLPGPIIQDILKSGLVIIALKKKRMHTKFFIVVIFAFYRDQALALGAIKRAFFYYIFLLRNFVRDPISQNPNIISAFLSSCLVSDRIVIWLIIKVLLVVVIVTVHGWFEK